MRMYTGAREHTCVYVLCGDCVCVCECGHVRSSVRGGEGRGGCLLSAPAR